MISAIVVLTAAASGAAAAEVLNLIDGVLAECAQVDAASCRSRLHAIVDAAPLAHFWLGLVAQQSTPPDPAAALGHYEAALRFDPAHVDSMNNIGKILADAGQGAEALDAFAKALATDPAHRMARVNLALDLHSSGASPSSQRHRRGKKVRVGSGRVGRSLALIEAKDGALAGRFEEALVHWDMLLRRDADDAESWYNAAVSLQHLGRVVDSANAYAEALRVRPAYVEARINLAAIHHRHGSIAEAVHHYEAALAVLAETGDVPLAVMTRNNVGLAYLQLGQFGLATASHEAAIKLADAAGMEDDAEHGRAHVLKTKISSCGFEGREDLVAELLAIDRRRLGSGRGPVLLPFDTLLLPVTGAWRLAAARAQSQLLEHFVAVLPRPSPAAPSSSSSELRVAYICFDFNDHPTAHLVEGLFRWHRRLRLWRRGKKRKGGVRAAALSYGKDDGSDYRAAIAADADQFSNLATLGHREAVAEARRWPEGGGHVLVDLQGHTLGTRMELTAMRLAPIQVAYLIFPGTSGASFYDAALVDRDVVPPERARDYSERLVYLPASYQVNDYERHAAEFPSADAARGAQGLPPRPRLVLCNFNKADKLDAASLHVWLNVMRRVPGSVLWLLQPPPKAFDAVKANLEAEAAARGVDPRRLVWAPRVAKAQHLQRHIAADLFLDTFVYGAHSTATDALRGGLPLLTRAGALFPERVGISLLNNADVPEGLVTSSLREFEDVAVRLCQSPRLLAVYRRHLLERAPSSLLFDTRRLTNHIERAYQALWEVYRADGNQSGTRHVILPKSQGRLPEALY